MCNFESPTCTTLDRFLGGGKVNIFPCLNALCVLTAVSPPGTGEQPSLITAVNPPCCHMVVWHEAFISFSLWLPDQSVMQRHSGFLSTLLLVRALFCLLFCPVVWQWQSERRKGTGAPWKQHGSSIRDSRLSCFPAEFFLPLSSQSLHGDVATCLLELPGRKK